MRIRTVSLAIALCVCSATAVVRAELPRRAPFTPSRGLPRPRPQNKPATPPPIEARDFYYFNGERVPLLRSTSEVAVRFKGGPGAAKTLPAAAKAGRVHRNEGRSYQVVEINGPSFSDDVAQLRASEAVQAVSAVFTHPGTNTRVIATDEVVVKLRPGGTRRELVERAAALGLTIDRQLWNTADEFVLRLDDPKHADAVEKARLLHESRAFAWAEPNLIRQYKRMVTPNDPLFSSQWHLNNTGQGGGTVGGDVSAITAWNTQTGSASTVIAIVDDGVEKTHEDLSANIFTNPGEIAANGIDDDHNGFIDDVHGWDFYNDDNAPDPLDVNDDHGTAVAGVAAARGSNATGVTGICQTCRILPVKIFSPDYAGDSATANALRYAASFADVVNNSWGGGSPSNALQSAIQTGTTQGRGGKGSALLFASGNDANGHFLVYTESPVAAGTHTFRFTYSKDGSLVDGEDATWVAWAYFADGTRASFESGLPAGWTTGGSANWSAITDARHADEGLCLTKAAKSGTLGNDQESWLKVTKTVPEGHFYAYVWVSSEEGYDGLIADIDVDNNGTWDLTTSFLSGVPYIDYGVSYPAAYAESIAVGASSNYDCRSPYSQFGSQLAFVAPSSGGPLNLGIQTTDRTGADGYDSTNYTSTFGGTSSATPLASGVAALLLSRNSALTLSQLKSTMQSTADKVGGEPYVSGRNDRYGYGRINADSSLLAIGACAGITLTPYVLPDGAAGTSYNQTLTATGGTAAYTFAVAVGTLPPGLSLSTGGLLSGTPTAPGTYPITLRVTDASGCFGYRGYNIVIATASAGGTKLYVVTPCRIVDTRGSGGQLAHAATRDIQITGLCGIPSSATAVVANITAVAPTTTGFLALYPAGTTWPGNSTINYRSAKTRANNAILRLSNLGLTTVLNNGAPQHFIIDVTGYFQ